MKYTVAEFVEAFATVLNAMAQTLDTTGEPWMLVGGIAVGVWCEPRATRDLDFAIATPSDPSKLASSLRGAGFSVDERARPGAAVGRALIRGTRTCGSLVHLAASAGATSTILRRS